MRIAFAGCGYVADLYARTLALQPGLELAGVFDVDPERGRRFAAHWHTARFESLERLLGDPSIGIVVNLTPPAAHPELSRACLEAGKHVYSEKPLALEQSRAHELVELAEARGLHVSCAPCSLLGETAQTVWKALREERAGTVRLVHAEMDDGPVHRMPYHTWTSASGAPWPARSEFETGCTLEHAAYHVSWLAAFFGPARSVTAFASLQVPDKGLDPPLARSAPDLSVACIRFESGVVARLSCSILAPVDHRLRIIGDRGVLGVGDTWRTRSPVTFRPWITIRRRTLLSPWPHRLPLLGRSNPRIRRRGASQVDFLRGVAELADAVAQRRPPRLSSRFSLHVNEVVLAIHGATAAEAPREIRSSFDPIEAMPWAQS